MRKITRKALTVTAVAATAAALTAMPASAAVTSVDVSPGGNVAGSNNGPIAGLNKDTGAVLICQGSTASGTVQGGTGLSPIGIASLASVNFSNCVANNSIPTTVTALGLPWSLDVTDVSSGASTPGSLKGVKFQLDAPSIGCTSVITGPGGAGGFIDGVHTNGSPSQLSLPASAANNLVVTSTVGTCPTSLINVGDTVQLAGTYNLTPGQTIVAS